VHRASAGTLLLASVASAGAAVAATTLLEHYGVTSGSSLLHRAPSGVFGHRNHAGHFVALTLPAALALLRLDAEGGGVASRTRRVARGLGLACALLGGAAIMVTRSRAAWLAAAVCVGVVTASVVWARGEWSGARRRGTWTHRRAGAAWLAAMFVGAVLGMTLPSALDWRTSIGSSARRMTELDQGSGRGRLLQYATTISIARDNPLLGVGPGNWTVEYPRYATRGDPNLIPGPASAPRLPLNDWLGTLSESGAPVLLGVAWLALLVAWPAAVALGRARRTGRTRTADVALLSLLAGVVVLGSLDAVMQSPLGPVVVATLVAVLARRTAGVSAPRLPAWAGRVGVAAMVAGSLFLATLSARRLSAAMLYGDDPAPAAFRAAAAIDPSDFTAQFFAGYAYARAGDCRAAAPYLRAAEALQPSARSVRIVARGCVSR
jgi:O-antigen ligase